MSSKLLSREVPKNYLFVEGNDDKQVFIHLLNHYGITDSALDLRDRFKLKNESFKIKDCGSITQVLDELRIQLKDKDDTIKRFGVVVDADDTRDDTWKSISNILQNVGYSKVPKAAKVGGTLIQEEYLPKIGIWIMPDNVLPGMTEDFISFLGPQDDILWPLTVEVLQRVMATKRNFKLSYVNKARIHTWLAWQEEPGTPMGQAITKKYVDADAPHAKQFVAWIRKLYELEIS